MADIEQQARAICGNCGNAKGQHFAEMYGQELRHYCNTITNGDLFTEEPGDSAILELLMDKLPGVYEGLICDWKRENGHTASQPQTPAAEVPEDVRRDAERWRYLKEECTHHYGDGHSEPREAHLCLEWGQGPWIRDGSNDGRGRPDTFPGWDAIVDEMIARAADEWVDLDDDIAAAPAPEVSGG